MTLEKGLEANAVCFGFVIEASARSGELERAEGWLRRMCDMGFVPNAGSISCVVDGLCKRGEIEKAEYWIRRMQDSGVLLDAAVFSNIISAHAGEGRGLVLRDDQVQGEAFRILLQRRDPRECPGW